MALLLVCFRPLFWWCHKNVFTPPFVYVFICTHLKVCALSKRDVIPPELGFTNPFQSSFGRPLQQVALSPGLSYDDVQKDDFQFDMDAHDVMVFLHIQKTGGTSFGKHLVQDLDLKVFLSHFLLLGICFPRFVNKKSFID